MEGISKVTCQTTLFKRGSVSPPLAQSLSIHAVKKKNTALALQKLIYLSLNAHLRNA